MASPRFMCNLIDLVKICPRVVEFFLIVRLKNVMNILIPPAFNVFVSQTSAFESAPSRKKVAFSFVIQFSLQRDAFRVESTEKFSSKFRTRKFLFSLSGTENCFSYTRNCQCAWHLTFVTWRWVWQLVQVGKK